MAMPRKKSFGWS